MMGKSGTDTTRHSDRKRNFFSRARRNTTNIPFTNEQIRGKVFEGVRAITSPRFEESLASKKMIEHISTKWNCSSTNDGQGSWAEQSTDSSEKVVDALADDTGGRGNGTCQGVLEGSVRT